MQRNRGNIRAVSHLRLSENLRYPTPKRLPSQWQEGTTYHASDEAQSSIPSPQNQARILKSAEVSVSTQRLVDPKGESGLASRHYILTDLRGLCVLGRTHRCLQSLHRGSQFEQYVMYLFLSTCAGIGFVLLWSPVDYQQRSRQSVHQRLLVSVFRAAGSSDQHDRARSLPRQCVHRATMANGQKRGTTSIRLARHGLDPPIPTQLDSVVQRIPAASKPELPVPCRGVYKQQG